MKDINIISVIKSEQLDQKNYFKSLIRQAYEKYLITDDEIINIQFQINNLLEKLVYKYNGLESTSIRTEIAQEIQDSIYYKISIYLKKDKNPDDSIKKIRELGLEKIYEEGRKTIYKMLDSIRVMYIKVKQNKLNIDNDIYNDTLIKGIKGFLKIYDPDYKAQDMKITADYPLYNDLTGKLEGIEFIKKYINSIYLENSFCQKFSEEKIKYLLCSYFQNYKDLIINVFEIVLLETFACKLINKNVKDLIITKSQLNEIYLIFKNKEDKEIENIIMNVYDNISKELLNENEQELYQYIDINMQYIKQLIKNSLKQRNLDKIFITEKYININ